MPLPDERPRQSVANLIGRFEQKRQSMTGIVPSQLPASFSRSTSVASHTTGDSAKEEILQKREWPPKSTLTDEKPKITPMVSSFVALSAKSPPIIEAVALPSVEPPAAGIVVSLPAAEPIKDPKPSTANSKSAPVRKASSTPVKIPAPKPSAAQTPQKSPVTPRPKTTSTIGPPKSQPLRQQHTGTSTKSAATTTPSSFRSPKSSAKSTPNRPKTPSSASTPNSRSKTPSGVPPRSKTPSSGLFAPTAASLAKARNAAPPVPTPVKKATLSSSAAERLSKPTAASISKVRRPTVSPAAKVSTPARGGIGAVNTPTKPRVGLAPVPARAKEPARNGAAKAAAGTTAVATVAVAAPVIEGEIAGVDDDKLETAEQWDDQLAAANGHERHSGYSNESPVEGNFEHHVEEPEIMSQGVGEECISHGVEPEGHIDAEVSESSELLVNLPTSHSPAEQSDDPEYEYELDAENTVEVGDEEAHADEATEHEAPTEPHHEVTEPSGSQPAPAEDDEEAHTENTDVQAEDNIDNIDSLPESAHALPASKLRPISMASIPDDAPDIPDEE